MVNGTVHYIMYVKNIKDIKKILVRTEHEHKMIKKLFDRIVDRVLRQEIPTDDAYNIALFNDLMAICCFKDFS